MPKRNLIWFVAIAIAAVVIVWVTRKDSSGPGFSGRMELKPVVHAYRRIKSSYYLPVREEDLCNGAIVGMLSALDPYCSFVPPGMVEAFERRIRGMERGVGLRLEKVDGQIGIVGAASGAPVQKTELSTGDWIIAVDGRKVEGMDPSQVERLLDGKVGTSVRLTVLGADGKRRTVKLTRDEFAVESVEGLHRDEQGQWVYAVDPDAGIAYVRIGEFVPSTGRRFERAFSRIGDLRGLILDLRDNPGGQLPSTVRVADMFLREGVIVTEVGKAGKRETHSAHPDGTYPDIPIVVLINARSASGAEIVAGALRLHDRAVLVGTRTCGKGCVQRGFDLPNGTGRINLTIAEYILGDSCPINRRPGSETWGVDPHVRVVVSPRRKAELDRLRVRAVVLPLPGGAASTTRPGAPKTEPRVLHLDAQLARAVELLKAPREMENILERAAAERARKTTLPADPVNGRINE